MGNGRKITELLYASFVIMFLQVLFPSSIKDSIRRNRYFMASRTDNDLHLMATFDGDNIVLHDKAGKVGVVGIREIPRGTPITRVIHRLHQEKKEFNIHFDCSSRALYIYFQSIFPNYIFQLRECPGRDMQPVEVVRSLDDFYLQTRPMDEKLVSTLLYLGLCGCLSEKLFVLYREMLVIVNSKGQRFFFGFNFSMLPFFRESVPGTSKEEYFSNQFLVSFNIQSSTVFFYAPEVGAGLYGISSNPFEREFGGLFPPRRDIEIKLAIERDDYEKLKEMVSDRKRSEVNRELFLLLRSLCTSDFLRGHFMSKKKGPF